MRKHLLRTLAFAAMVLPSAFAHANALKVDYFTVSNGDPDFGGQCCGVYNNEVKNTLGLGGLPVYNSGYGGPALSDTNGLGELTWWSPLQNSNVHFTGSGIVSLPYSNGAFFPPNGKGPNDANGFQTAVFSGLLIVPKAQNVTFNLAADDDALLALGGSVIGQLGGVHSNTALAPITESLNAGVYSLKLFYADRDQVAASLSFDVSGATCNAVPLPASAPLFGAALVAFGAIGFGLKRKKAAATA